MNLSLFHPRGSKISFSAIEGSCLDWKNVILYPKNALSLLENYHPLSIGFTEKTSIWPRLLVGYIAANGWLATASHMWHQKEKGYSPFPETFPWEKLQHTRVNILDLKILQVFFKNRGGNLVFLKNVEFLEFFGFTLCFRTFQAKFFFQNFSDL